MRQKDFTPVGGLDTPYKKAKQIWDNRIGSALHRAQIMSFFSLGCLLLALISIIGMFSLLRKPKVIPYIVEINSNGQISNFGKMLEKAYDYTPSLVTTRYFVGRFIRNIRELSSDIVIVKKQGQEAFNYVTPRGNAILIKYLQEDNPLSNYDKITRDVELLNFLQVDEQSNTYQSYWKETTYNLAGDVISVKTYRGVFVLIRKENVNEEELFKNPLSMYIDTFVMAEDSK